MFRVVTGIGVGLHYGSSFVQQYCVLLITPPQSSSEVQFPQLFLIDLSSQNPATGTGVGVHYGSFYAQQYCVLLLTPPQSSSPVHFSQLFLLALLSHQPI